MPNIGIHMLLRFALLQLSIMCLVSESEANIPTEAKIIVLTAVANFIPLIFRTVSVLLLHESNVSDSCAKIAVGGGVSACEHLRGGETGSPAVGIAPSLSQLPYQHQRARATAQRLAGQLALHPSPLSRLQSIFDLCSFNCVSVW